MIGDGGEGAVPGGLDQDAGAGQRGRPRGGPPDPAPWERAYSVRPRPNCTSTSSGLPAATSVAVAASARTRPPCRCRAGAGRARPRPGRWWCRGPRGPLVVVAHASHQVAQRHAHVCGEDVSGVSKAVDLPGASSASLRRRIFERGRVDIGVAEGCRTVRCWRRRRSR